MNAKPIFIIKFPTTQGFDSVLDQRRDVAKGLSDYHILFVPTDGYEFQFECYNSEKAHEIDFELLQTRVLELAKMASIEVPETNY